MNSGHPATVLFRTISTSQMRHFFFEKIGSGSWYTLHAFRRTYTLHLLRSVPYYTAADENRCQLHGGNASFRTSPINPPRRHNSLEMENKTRISNDDKEALKSAEDANENRVSASASRVDSGVGTVSSRELDRRSLSSTDSISADKKLVQDALKRYTESIEARGRKFVGERRQRQQMPSGIDRPLDASVEGGMKQKKQKISDNDKPPDASIGGGSKQKKQKTLDIENPLDADVLFGRRDTQRFHPGNVHLRALCETYRNEYESGDREVKAVVKKKIIDEIGAKGGRFLKRRAGETTWYHVDEEVALEKVAFTMRDTRDRKKP